MGEWVCVYDNIIVWVWGMSTIILLPVSVCVCECGDCCRTETDMLVHRQLQFAIK